MFASAASPRINSAQPTHSCVDEESPLLIRHGPQNLDGRSPEVMQTISDNQCVDVINLHEKFSFFITLPTSLGKICVFISFSGWKQTHE